MRQIVNLWQSATGQRIKDAEAVASSSAPGQPMRVPVPGTPAAPSSNGAATVAANGSTTVGVS
jgi:hypothetical protein